MATLRDKRTIVYGLYCVIVVLLIIAIALIYRPHNHPVASTVHQHSTQRHPAGASAGNSGSTPLAVNGNGKGTNRITSVSNTPPSSSTASQAPLSNSGPGNIFGLFALVSVLGAWVWRRKLIRSVIR